MNNLHKIHPSTLHHDYNKNSPQSFYSRTLNSIQYSTLQSQKEVDYSVPDLPLKSGMLYKTSCTKSSLCFPCPWPEHAVKLVVVVGLTLPKMSLEKSYWTSTVLSWFILARASERGCRRFVFSRASACPNDGYCEALAGEMLCVMDFPATWHMRGWERPEGCHGMVWGLHQG